MYRADRNADRLTTPVEGWCLTDDQAAAEHYARSGGSLAVIDIDLDDLVVVEVEGYDRNENHTPADAPAFRARMAAQGADVLVYDDEDENGRAHRTWRLVSDRAVAACRVSDILIID